MATTKIKPHDRKIGQTIREKLDGRTQRWLAEKIGIPEDKLSNKLAGRTPFTEEELEKINQLFSTQ